MDAESLLRPWVCDADQREISIRQCLHPLPCSSPALATAPKRSIPMPDGIAAEVAEGFEVGRDGVVGKIATHNLLEPCSLLGNGQM